MGRAFSYPSWIKIRTELRFAREWINRVDDFELMIERYAYSQKKIDDLKQIFTRNAQDTSSKPYVSNIREYL